MINMCESGHTLPCKIKYNPNFIWMLHCSCHQRWLPPSFPDRRRGKVEENLNVRIFCQLTTTEYVLYDTKIRTKDVGGCYWGNVYKCVRMKNLWLIFIWEHMALNAFTKPWMFLAWMGVEKVDGWMYVLHPYCYGRMPYLCFVDIRIPIAAQ